MNNEPTDREVSIVVEMVREGRMITACTESFAQGFYFALKLKKKGRRMSEIEKCQIIDRYDETLRDGADRAAGDS